MIDKATRTEAVKRKNRAFYRLKLLRARARRTTHAGVHAEYAAAVDVRRADRIAEMLNDGG